MLGVIHRAVIGKGPTQINDYFKMESGALHPNGRSTLRKHNRQLRSFRRGKFLETIAKSIFGLVDIYNMLPQQIIDTTCVHNFQRQLQGLLKQQAILNVTDWEHLFSPRHALHNHPLARMLNRVGTISIAMNDTEAMPDPSMDMGDNNGITDDAGGDRPPSWW